MMGGWLPDDCRMPVDERKTWGNLWNLFWSDVLNLDERAWNWKHDVDMTVKHGYLSISYSE